MKLNKKDQKELLAIARKTLESFLKNGKIPQFEFSNAKFKQPCGVFVTLKKDGQLRGCLGELETKESLGKMVQKNAVAAATKDPRFPPVRLIELPEIRIEISVLSPLKMIDDPKKIKLGKHGVMIKKSWRRGVFLPQVAAETGWTKEAFMGHLCSQKAGLDWDAWKTGEVDIYIFTAQVFGEND